MDQVSVRAEGQGFEVTIEGTSIDALSFRRIVNQFSLDAPADPSASKATYSLPPGRVRAVLLALSPHLARTGTPLLRDARAEAELAALTSEVNTLGRAFRGDLPPAAFQLGPRFRRSLTPQQEQAVARLLALPHGANFSVPGSGKTTITLALHELLRERGSVSRLLVIAPRNAFRPWEEEVAACFAPPPYVVRLAGGIRRVRQLLSDIEDNSILLIGYQQAYFAADVLERWLIRHPGVHIVLDESHHIKNPRRGAWATTVLRIATLAARRDILTGTPAPNATEDLSTQLSFLWPFQSIIPESALRGAHPEDTVTARLRPLYVRITKRQLGLSDPALRRTTVKMGTLQRAIHDRIAHSTLKKIGGHRIGPGTLQAIRLGSMRLLQLASNPALVLTTAEEFRIPPLQMEGEPELEELFAQYAEYEVPPKFALAVQRVRERASHGKKTIVWSSFVRNLGMLARLLVPHGPVVLHGGVPTAIDMDDVPEASREALIDQFKHDANCHVMIANPAACSESVSLHRECDYAIYLDRTFNAAAFLQSMDRIHRLGLPASAHVTYELLVSPDTVDDVVDRRLEVKVQRLGRLLDDDALRTMRLDIVGEDDAAAFDAEDARQVIAFLRVDRGI
jgi:hypothetical protein